MVASSDFATAFVGLRKSNCCVLFQKNYHIVLHVQQSQDRHRRELKCDQDQQVLQVNKQTNKEINHWLQTPGNSINSCYYSWARTQNFFCLQLHANEAKGSIQWEITHYPRLCVKTAGNCNNSYSFYSNLNTWLEIFIRCSLTSHLFGFLVPKRCLRTPNSLPLCYLTFFLQLSDSRLFVGTRSTLSPAKPTRGSYSIAPVKLLSVLERIVT